MDGWQGPNILLWSARGGPKQSKFDGNATNQADKGWAEKMN